MKVLWQSLHRDARGLALAVGLGVLLIVFNIGVLQPRRQTGMCQSNLKRMGIAFMQYVADYDSTFPLGYNWAEALEPYSRNNSVFHCPALGNSRWSYALNSRAAAMSHHELYAPFDSVLAFESDGNKRNAVDNGTSLPKFPRHAQGYHILFGAGNVKAVDTGQTHENYGLAKMRIR